MKFLSLFLTAATVTATAIPEVLAPQSQLCDASHPQAMCCDTDVVTLLAIDCAARTSFYSCIP